MSGAHLPSVVTWGSAFVSGGGLTALCGWVVAGRKKRRDHQRLWDLFTGTPAAPGVPATPSLIDRIEKVITELGQVRADVAEAKELAAEAQDAAATAVASFTKWTRAVERWKRLFDRRLSRLEEHPAIGLG